MSTPGLPRISIISYKTIAALLLKEDALYEGTTSWPVWRGGVMTAKRSEPIKKKAVNRALTLISTHVVS